MRTVHSDGFSFPLPEGADTDELLAFVPGEQTRALLAARLQDDGDAHLPLFLADALLAAVAEWEREQGGTT